MSKQPLKSPAKESVDLDDGGVIISEIQRLEMQSIEKIKAAKDTDVILLIGNVGSGKSTATNYLLGCDFDPVIDESNGACSGAALKRNSRLPSASMGYTDKPETFFPAVYAPYKKHSEDKRGIVSYGDTPGFSGSESREAAACVVTNIDIMIRFARSIKGIFIIIEYGSFQTQRGAGFRMLMGTLTRLLINPGKVRESIFIVITKVRPGADEALIKKRMSVLVQTMKEQIITELKTVSQSSADRTSSWHERLVKLTSELTMIDFIESRINKLIVMDIFNDKVRKNISTLLLKNNIPKSSFNFHMGDQCHLDFSKWVYKVAHEYTPVLRNLVELPRIIQYGHEQSVANEMQLNLYEQRLSNNIPNDEQTVEMKNSQRTAALDLLKQQIARNANSIDGISERIKVKESEISALENEKKILDTHEPIVYWGKQPFKEERSRLARFFTLGLIGIGWSEKEFSYHDIPFTSSEKDCENGQWVESETVCKPESGIYKRLYQSDRGKDGFAQVKIFVAKKNIPDNKKRIVDINSDLVSKKQELENLKQDQAELVRTNNSLTASSLDIVEKASEDKDWIEKMKKNLLEEQERLKKKSVEIQKSMFQKEGELEEARTIFSENRKVIETVIEICQCLPFDSNLVDEFLLQFGSLASSKDKLLKNLHSVAPKEYLCFISQKIMQNPMVSNCRHSFDDESINDFFDREHKDTIDCPTCNTPIKRKEMALNITLKNLIDKWINRQLELIPLDFSASVSDQGDHPYDLSGVGEQDDVSTDSQMKTNSNPTVYRTKGEGDCAFHAILGEWSARDQQYVCHNIQEQRHKVAQAIRDSKQQTNVYRLAVESIKHYVMTMNSIGAETRKLIETYKNYLEKNATEIDQSWQGFDGELKQYDAIVQYISQNHGLSENSNTRQRFYQVLNDERTGDTLRGLILSVPALEEQFKRYCQLAQESFGWEASITPAIINEYASRMGQPGEWSLPSELHLIAEVMSKTIIFYPASTAEPIYYNEGCLTSVRVQFNGVNHYERVTIGKNIVLSSSPQQKDVAVIPACLQPLINGKSQLDMLKIVEALSFRYERKRILQNYLSNLSPSQIKEAGTKKEKYEKILQEITAIQNYINDSYQKDDMSKKYSDETTGEEIKHATFTVQPDLSTSKSDSPTKITASLSARKKKKKKKKKKKSTKKMNRIESSASSTGNPKLNLEELSPASTHPVSDAPAIIPQALEPMGMFKPPHFERPPPRNTGISGTNRGPLLSQIAGFQLSRLKSEKSASLAARPQKPKPQMGGVILALALQKALVRRREQLQGKGSLQSPSSRKAESKSALSQNSMLNTSNDATAASGKAKPPTFGGE